MIKITDSFSETVNYDTFTFPSGSELHVKLPKAHNFEKSTITCFYESSNDLMLLLLITDALKRCGTKEIALILPYLPYARQDRVMSYGEPLSIKVFANTINSQKYERVVVCDAHSDVSTALLDNCVNMNIHADIMATFEETNSYYLVSPDAGALKKTHDLAKKLDSVLGVVTGTKVRNVTNGEITKTTIDATDLQGKDCIIVDDICDGGRTFVELAKVLRAANCGSVYLIVTHGIFSKGIDALEGIDYIYTTNSVCKLPNSEKLHVWTIF